jgi:hypothetical protein
VHRLDERGLDPEVADDADQRGNEPPEQRAAPSIARGLVGERRDEVEYRKHNERRQKEPAEEALVEAPGLAEHAAHRHSATLSGLRGKI